MRMSLRVYKILTILIKEKGGKKRMHIETSGCG